MPDHIEGGRAMTTERDADAAQLAGIRRFLDELEQDCSPLAEDPENSIEYNEGLCDERGRIAGILDSLLSPEAALRAQGDSAMEERLDRALARDREAFFSRQRDSATTEGAVRALREVAERAEVVWELLRHDDRYGHPVYDLGRALALLADVPDEGEGAGS